VGPLTILQKFEGLYTTISEGRVALWRMKYRAMGKMTHRSAYSQLDYWKEAWVNPNVGLDTVVKRKNSYPAGNEPHSTVTIPTELPTFIVQLLLNKLSLVQGIR
jgi:hypothetical protein